MRSSVFVLDEVFIARYKYFLVHYEGTSKGNYSYELRNTEQSSGLPWKGGDGIHN